MVVTNMASAPAGKTYEAWVIVDGKATPAGTFAAGDKTVIVRLRHPVPSGAIVAVTVEPHGRVAAADGAPVGHVGAGLTNVRKTS